MYVRATYTQLKRLSEQNNSFSNKVLDQLNFANLLNFFSGRYLLDLERRKLFWWPGLAPTCRSSNAEDEAAAIPATSERRPTSACFFDVWKTTIVMLINQKDILSDRRFLFDLSNKKCECQNKDRLNKNKVRFNLISDFWEKTLFVLNVKSVTWHSFVFDIGINKLSRI